jgi:hypothetical protein
MIIVIDYDILLTISIIKNEKLYISMKSLSLFLKINIKI